MWFHLNQHETDYMHAEIFERRCYAHPRMVLPAGACIFDVGANIGMFSLFAIGEWEPARVYAFEPIPDIYEALANNFGQSDRVRTFDYGMAGAHGFERFVYYPRYSMMSGKYADPLKDRALVRQYVENRSFMLPNVEEGAILREHMDMLLAGRFESVVRDCEVRPLSAVIAGLGIDRIDLLKLDVEGCELEVLSSVARDDWRKIGHAVVEVEEFDGRLAHTVALLEAHGFGVDVRQESDYVGTNLYVVFGLRG